MNPNSGASQTKNANRDRLQMVWETPGEKFVGIFSCEV